MGSTYAPVEPIDIAAAISGAWSAMCDWMNANAGTAASVISAIAAILAIWVAVRIQRENTSPSVIAYIEKDGNAAFKLILKNIGQGAAYDVRITGFDMGMVQDGASSFVAFAKNSFIKNGVPMLAPGSTRETVLASTVYAKDNLTGKTCDVDISWLLRRNGRKRESCRFTLEYGSFLDSIHIDSLEQRAVRALEGIQQGLTK